nr:NADH dehydrogenase subunit 6 [Lilioceris yunnana]
MIMIMKINFMLAITFMFLSHPLSLGLILLTQTLMVSLNTGMMNLNFWFSYILFIVMIGGMLILFMYMTSVASNEKFKFSPKLTNLMIMIFILLMVSTKYDFIYNYMLINSIEIKQQNLNLAYQLSMNKYMNYPNNMMMYMMFFYLFITMIMATKITNLKQGPLRQKI